ncbi:MAG: MarR family transcriptional regulator [Rhodospirillales bacterium]|nr:MarR family transcriptional regulator [Rhodospirillales bacterium]
MAKSMPEEQLSFDLSLVNLAHRWRLVIDDELRPLGFSQATWRTLFFVSRAGGQVRQKDLAVDIGIEGPSLVHLLDSLEDAGLIRRAVSAVDRRVKLVNLTSTGNAEMRRIETVLDAVRASLLQGLDKDQLALSIKIFDRIKTNAAVHEEQAAVAAGTSS